MTAIKECECDASPDRNRKRLISGICEAAGLRELHAINILGKAKCIGHFREEVPDDRRRANCP
jgi:hypothetical protein